MASRDPGHKLVWMALLMVAASPIFAGESDSSPVVRRYKVIELPLKPVYVGTNVDEGLTFAINESVCERVGP